jgi:hypothetical protein
LILHVVCIINLQNCLEEVKELIFLKSLHSLDKEDVKEIRTKLGELLKSLFKSESKDKKKKSLVQLFFKLIYSNNHNSELDTFFLIAGVLVEDHTIFSDQDWAQLLVKIEEILNPISFDELIQSTSSITQQGQDYTIFQALRCLRKGLDRRSGKTKLEKYNLWERKSPHAEIMRKIFTHLTSPSCLLYEHVWIPPVVLDILFHILTQLELLENDGEKMDKFAAQLEAGDKLNSFLLLLKDEPQLKSLIGNVWNILKFDGDHSDEVVMKVVN